MIHQLIALILTALMHIICFTVISERKYSVKKTVLIYSAFMAVFICLAMLMSRIFFDKHSFYAMSAAYISTIFVSFIIFMVTSADPASKKVFLFLNYASVFCIFFCFSIMVSSIWFKDELSAAAMYTKTIIRILLYQHCFGGKKNMAAISATA